MRRGSRHGIDLFIEEGAYTTVAAAVSILVVLTLLFSAVTAIWSLSRSGDVQVSADATALAGANVVASYHTAATVLDASVLSMGLAGFCVAGAGLVGMLVPGAQALAGETVDAGIRMIKLRNDLAASASRGLSTLETSLPYLIAANAARTCAAQGSEEAAYTGTAIAVPLDSASSFPALAGEGVSTQALESASDELDVAAQSLASAAEETARARQAAWIADCGRAGRSMQERAARLTEMSATQNPDYASSVTWNPMVAIERARAYYRWRMENVSVEGSGAEAEADAAAREAFFRYANEVFERARFEETEQGVIVDVPLLPRNTEEVRRTSLYTDAMWPSTYEDGVPTLHYGMSCPGATGPAGPHLALEALDAGAARTCTVCGFSVGDVGKTPAASTSIDNGFEYHLRECTLALNDYASCRNRELELERAAQGEAEQAGAAFEEALGVLAGKRPRIAPPGRYGCVAAVAGGARITPEELSRAFVPGEELAERGAISAATLAPDAATRENNVLSMFLSTFEERAGGGGAAGLVGDVMGLWGGLLVSYGDLGDGLSRVMDDLLGGLSSMGMGRVATWLNGCIDAAVGGLGLEPVDLSLRKPVLTDTAKVLSQHGDSGLVEVQQAVRSIPLGSTDPAAIARSLGYELRNEVASQAFTLAQIPMPGGGSVPLTIRVSDLVSLAGAS